MKKLTALLICLLMLGSLLPTAAAESLEPIEFTIYFVDAFSGENPGEMQIMKDHRLTQILVNSFGPFAVIQADSTARV